MSRSFYFEQFKLGVLKPAIWVLEARRLRRSADIIFNAYYSDLKKIESGESPLDQFNLELCGCATLLYALALENAIKAVIIQNNPNFIENGKLKKWPSDGHDLILLSKSASLSIDKCDEDLLRRFSSFIRWAGRYPIPKDSNQMRLKQISVPGGFVPLPLQIAERPNFDRLLKKIESKII